MLPSYLRRKAWEHGDLAKRIAVEVGTAFFGTNKRSAPPADLRNSFSSPDAFMAMANSRFVD